jgi:hypothetical protein
MSCSQLRIKQLFNDVAPHLADPRPRTRTAGGSPRLKEIDGYVGGMKTAVARETKGAAGLQDPPLTIRKV